MVPSTPAIFPIDHEQSRLGVTQVLTYDGTISVRWGLYLSAIGQVRRLSLAYEAAAWMLCKLRAHRGSLRTTVLSHPMYLNAGDSGISKELAVYRIHEPRATMVLRQVLKPGMTVIDIGANVGYYSLIASAAVGPTGRVIAIEPVSSNVNLLINNATANGCGNVQIWRGAICDYDGTARMHLSTKSNWHSLIPGATTTSASVVGEEEVPAARLGSVISRVGLESVDLVRMDIEGYEATAIDGMNEVLRLFSPALLMELHPNIIGSAKTLQLLENLEAVGYGLRVVIDRAKDWPWSNFKLKDRPWRAEGRGATSLYSSDLGYTQRLIAGGRPLTVLLSKQGGQG